MHGCRKSALRNIKLHCFNGRNPIELNCHFMFNLFWNILNNGIKIAYSCLNNKGRRHKSSFMSQIYWATHVLQWWKNNESRICEYELISQSLSKFGLFSEIWEYEGGITSNRGWACCGEYLTGFCTHRPSRQGSWLDLKLIGVVLI